MASFHVDGRVCVKMEMDLAVRLGEFIVKSATADKQLKAMGHQLIELEVDSEANELAVDVLPPIYAPASEAYVTASHRPVHYSQSVFVRNQRDHVS